MISEQDELLVHPHQVLPGDTQDSLQLHLPAPRFFLEFYYNPFPASGIEKRFTYTASIAYPIAVFEVDIQQPLQASNFTLDPPPMERLTDNRGFTYYQFVTRDMRQGQTQTFTISYTKTTTSPSVPKQPPVPQRPGQRGPLSDNRPLALGILAGAIVLFAGWAWLLHDPRRQRASVTASAPQATATLSTLFALVQEHGETQETTVAMPPQAHPREINFCAHCGRKLLPDDRFCAGCGRPIKR